MTLKHSYDWKQMIQWRIHLYKKKKLKNKIKIENSRIETMAENENISNPHFFEGVEKLLEIWFTPNPLNKNADLRKIPR